MGKTMGNRKIIIWGFLLILAIGSAFYFVRQTYGQEVKNSNHSYGDNPKQTLDIYSPAQVENDRKLPVIVYVHGGGWTGGDKNNVANKPAFFTGKGFVFVSVNYRLSPQVDYQEIAADVATAFKWVYDNADHYHIDRSKLNLMGHSAGGHLVTLIGTNPAYLNQVGLSPQTVNSIVDLDGPVDLRDFIQRVSDYKKVFGNDEKVWDEASPITYAANKNLPPLFLVTRRNSSISTFTEKARSAGNTADSFECLSLSHSEVTKLLGNPLASREAQSMTEAVTGFLEKYN